jgi:chromate transport protein ChrA
MCKRVLLVMGSALLALNLYVLLVAFTTSGKSLIWMSSAWYAAVAPMVAFTYAIVLGSMPRPGRFTLCAGAFVFAMTLPAIWLSFMHSGMFIPILILLWLCVAFGESGEPQESR